MSTWVWIPIPHGKDQQYAPIIPALGSKGQGYPWGLSTTLSSKLINSRFSESLPWTLMWTGEWLGKKLSVDLWFPHACTHTCTHMCVHTGVLPQWARLYQTHTARPTSWDKGFCMEPVNPCHQGNNTHVSMNFHRRMDMLTFVRAIYTGESY